MSRIFDALKHAQQIRSTGAPPNRQSAGALPITDRRRSRRQSLNIPVYVYGHGPERDPFHEEAHTLTVSSGGALLLLSVPVEKGQTLLLTNRLTQKELECRVVYLGARRSRTVEAGVAFWTSSPGFWQSQPSRKHKPA